MTKSSHNREGRTWVLVQSTTSSVLNKFIRKKKRKEKKMLAFKRMDRMDSLSTLLSLLSTMYTSRSEKRNFCTTDNNFHQHMVIYSYLWHTLTFPSPSRWGKTVLAEMNFLYPLTIILWGSLVGSSEQTLNYVSLYLDLSRHDFGSFCNCSQMIHSLTL